MTIFEGKTLLVTGGTGSMGKRLVHRVLGGEQGVPEKIIVLSRDEAKQHEMRMQYQHKLVSTDDVIFRNFMQVLEFRIGDVRNYEDVCSAVKDADIVINAAALKQVPTCEYFPHQAVLTNCIGASNIVRAIREHSFDVEVVVGISTDKACMPVNVMGMTKAIQERIFLAANVLIPDTRFICVRYGNVLASRGSVIPLFHHQIRSGGPVTVTVPGMTRFLLSLHEAVDTVFAALENARPGETYVPDAPSAEIMNIAKALVGDRGLDIELTGIRPGEKMHEVLVSSEEAHHCHKVGDYFAIRSLLPELRADEGAASPALDKELSSADAVLDYEGTIELLERHGLLIDQVDPSSQPQELLR